MELSTNSWFLQMEQNECDMMGCLDDQVYTNEFVNLTQEDLAEILGEDFLNTFSSSPSTLISDHPFGATSPPPSDDRPQQAASADPPVERKKIGSYCPSNAPIILNFGKRKSPEKVLNPEEEAAVSEVLRNKDLEEVSTQPANKANQDRQQSQTYDHILSERKRRKLLSEQFLTLSGMVPGLKKTDKTSVLGETIKYLQNLQERMEMLEEKLTKEVVESAVLIRKSQIMIEDEGSSDENSSCSSLKQPLPEIEAKVCNNQALLRIHCEKQKGIMMKILAEVERLNLIVLHSNASPFGNLALDITIVVEKDKESTLMASELVHALHSSLRMAS